MPIYGYRCKKCSYYFEEFISMNDRFIPLQSPCPSCGDITLYQDFSSPPKIGDPVLLGVKKLPGDWRDFLKEMKRKYPDSEIRDR